MVMLKFEIVEKNIYKIFFLFTLVITLFYNWETRKRVVPVAELQIKMPYPSLDSMSEV